MTIKRYAARVQYDGSQFFGWQKQKNHISVQQVVEQALSEVADRPVQTITAGRTDTGVHATSQFIHFDTDAERKDFSWIRGANTHLPSGVALDWVGAVDDSFHARFSAQERQYRYLIYNCVHRSALHPHLATWFFRPLDIAKMQAAANLLRGKYDFSAYRASSCQSQQPVKDLRQLTITRHGDWIACDFAADGFLHHMVRNIMGVLMSIGLGEKPVEWAGQVLASKQRSQGGVTALANGLYFTHVAYPEAYTLPCMKQKPTYW